MNTLTDRLGEEKNNLSVLPGYKILEWEPENETEGKVNDSLQNVYAITIQQVPIQYNVAFNSNDRAGSMNNQEFTFDVTQKLTDNSFTREGYTFNGWKDDNRISYADKQLQQ